jgi:integral membrane protein (TIGR01906 family)
MTSLHPAAQNLLYWLVTILTPLLILMSAVRLLMTPAFVQLEYRMPSFPEDTYGFTQQDRLRLAPIALDYLLNDEEISFLGDLEFGDGSPLYNERELSHMVDVKRLVTTGLRIWYGLLALFAALGLWAWRGGWLAQYRLMLASGGRLTVILIGVLLVITVVNFNQIFVGFHSIFFEGDSWLFLFSDTLIRLFPLRFWQDVFIFVGLLTLGGGLGFWLLLGRARPA